MFHAEFDGRYVRVREGIAEWRCVACSSWHPFATDECDACGTPRRRFADRGRPVQAVSPVADGQPHVARSGSRGVVRLLAILATAVVAGGGHLVLRRVGSAAARVLVTAVWLAVGLAAFVPGVDPGWATGPLAGGVVLTGAVLLWMASLVDVVTLTGPRARELLGSRVLLWLVVAVTAALAGATVLDTSIEVG